MSTPDTLEQVEKITGPLVKPKKTNGAARAGAPIIATERPYPKDMSDEQVLEQFAFSSANGARLKKLLGGDISDYPSASEADLACASDLAFWLHLDPQRIEDAMRDSDLARDKWDENKTYLARTIHKALEGKTDYFGKRTPVQTNGHEVELPKTEAKADQKMRKDKDGDKPPDPKAFDYKQHMKSMQDLLDNPPPPIVFVLLYLLARGACSLLIGKPKSFKTTLAMQIALALCGNKRLLADWAEFGTIQKSCRVAIIDYEQSEQIATQMMLRFKAETVKGLVRIDAFPKLDETGVNELRKLITEQKLDVVIIDSWTRAMPAMRPGSGVFMGEAEIMQRITNLAHETGCHIMVIAHGGKRDAADDPMQMIAGTNALPASVDDVLVLFKDGEDEGSTVRRKLFVSGRNIAKHGTYVLEKRDVDACFVLKGSEDSYVRGEARRKILGLLGGGAALTPNDLAKSMGRDRAQVYRALMSLVEAKLVIALDKGRYIKRSAKIVASLKKTEESDDE